MIQQTISRTASRPHSVRVCALQRDQAGRPCVKQALSQQAAALLAATCIVLSPATAPVLAAEQAMLTPEDASEQERIIQDQKLMLEFKLRQQENAKKAELNAQRQNLERQVVQVENQLEQKLTEQRANIVGATSKGDTRKAEIIETQVAELTAKLEQVKKVAAQLNSQVDRAEILERARTQAALQTVNKAVAR